MSWLALVESNTTGSGRLFCRAARSSGMRPVVLTREPDRYPYLRTDALDSLVVDTVTVDAVVDVCERLAGDVWGSSIGFGKLTWLLRG